MKLCFIDWFAYGLFNPESKIVFGGAQIQLYLIANELAKTKEFDVSFLTNNQHSKRRDKFGRIAVYQFIRSPRIPGIFGRLINITGYAHFFLRLWRQLSQIDADVYWQRAASAETGLIALIARILRKKFIFMVAHIQDVNGDFIARNGWRGKLFLLGLKLADKIICQTYEQQKLLVRSLQSKSVVISPGYPIKRVKRIKKAGILWVARAERWKGPEIFIEMAKKNPQEKFIMICPPAENNPGYFHRIKKSSRSVSNLKFIDRVPFGKIDNYFARAKIFVSTSFSEGFPNTFIQAANNHTPTMSLKINPDNIIDKYQIGFCAGGKKDKLTALLRKLTADKKLWQRLSENAYSYATQFHDLKKIIPSYIKLLLEN